MDGEISVPGRAQAADNPVFVAAFRILVPALLGAVLTYASSISSDQKSQGSDIALIKGTLQAIAQENMDYNMRLNKVERGIDELRKDGSTRDNRISLLEGRRYK